MYRKDKQKGQSLVEVLVAIAIAGIVIGSAVTTLIIVLRSNVQGEDISRASLLNQELIDGARSIAEASWHDIYNVEKEPLEDPPSHYIVRDGGSPVIVKGTEGIVGDDITLGLVGYWKFDEAKGTIAYDYSGNGNNGTFGGNASSLDGRVGMAREKTGDFTGTLATMPASSRPNASPFSVVYWFKPDVLLDWNDGLTQGWVGNGFNTNWDSNGSVRCGVALDGVQKTVGSASGAVVVGNWHNVACIYDDPSVYLYLDGKLLGSRSDAPGHATDLTSSITSLPGGDRGAVDDVRIYNRALSAEEIGQLYRSRIYTRNLTVADVMRNGGDIVETGGVDDPSTQEVTVSTTWRDGRIVSTTEYLTRFHNEIDHVTDWSDAGSYAQQEGIDTGTPGVITLE